MSREPYITIDLNDDLIRIPRVTLNMLENPEYVQLLIHPGKRKLALRKCGGNEIYANKINPTLLATENSVELHSKFLIDSLSKMCENLHDGRSNRITGKLHQEKCVISFDMSESVSIRENGQGNEK